MQAWLAAAQEAVHAALCASINTAAVLAELSDLITAVNKYLAKRPLPHGAQPDGAHLLEHHLFTNSDVPGCQQAASAAHANVAQLQQARTAGVCADSASQLRQTCKPGCIAIP